jgi:hypothetical protein
VTVARTGVADTPTVVRSVSRIKPHDPWTQGLANGQLVRILRDTGAEVGAVSKRLVKPEDLTGRTIEILMADRKSAGEKPMAWVEVDCSFVKGRVELVVLDDGPDIILGNWVTFENGERSPVTVDGHECARSAVVQARTQVAAEKRAEVPSTGVKQSQLEVTTPELIAVQEVKTLAKARQLVQSGESVVSGQAEVKFQGLLCQVHNKGGNQATQLVVSEMKQREEEVRTGGQRVVGLRGRVGEARGLVQRGLQAAARKQRRHFGRRAKRRKFRAGEQVLLLLPTKRNKLQMAWRGPYEVVERVGDCDYRIRVKGNTKLFHVNRVKRFHERVTIATVVVDELDGVEEEGAPPWLGDISVNGLTATKTVEDVQLDDSCPEIRQELLLVSEFQDVLTEVMEGGRCYCNRFR